MKWKSKVPKKEGLYFFCETGAESACYVTIEKGDNDELLYFFEGYLEPFTYSYVKNINVEQNWKKGKYPKPKSG